MTFVESEAAFSFDDEFEFISEPVAMPINFLKIEIIRAMFGLALILLGGAACISILVLVIFQIPMAGLAFGICAVAFILLTKAGAKYARTIPKNEWQAIEIGENT